MLKVDTVLLLNFAKNLAATPKHGEPEDTCPGEQYFQKWEDDCGKYAIERLHELIDEARDLLKSLHVKRTWKQ